jgi:hypothetical protein
MDTMGVLKPLNLCLRGKEKFRRKGDKNGKKERNERGTNSMERILS